MSEVVRRILIVEDEGAHVAAIKRALEGFAGDTEIVTASTVAECRAILSAEPPDIALMDLNLPDGQATELLVSPAEAGPCPIVIMTSYGNEDIAVRTMKSGALDYLVKSKEAFADMPRTVDRALREWHALTAAAAAEERIRTLNVELEERVVERTRQLADANEELASVNEELMSTNEELEQANIDVVQASSRVEAADRAKSEFLARMSHELRTPLNSIIGFTDILLKGLAGGLNEEQCVQLGMVNESGKHLLSLINDVLDLSRIESGRVVPEMQDVSVVSVAEVVVNSVRPLAEQRGLDLRVVIEATCAIVHSDPRSIQQILLNLLSNAVKFTNSGGVDLRVVCRGGELRFEVADTGIGLSDEELKTVFEEFTRFEHVGSETSEGTGLGLSVSRRLAQSLGGRIEVESVLGQGSTFTLVVPNPLC